VLVLNLTMLYRDRDQVTHQWKQYFQNLYTPSTSAELDSDWETYVSNKMNELHGNVYQTLDALVRPDDIHETIGNHVDLTICIMNI